MLYSVPVRVLDSTTLRHRSGHSYAGVRAHRSGLPDSCVSAAVEFGAFPAIEN